ncbi:hypothetical protein Tco_0738967 [Tanacetum coccineum]
MIDSQMDDMIKENLALKEQVDSLKQNLSKQIKENESLLQTFTVFKNESKEKEDKYMENEINLEKKIKELDNIVYKVGYQNPFYLKKSQRIKPTLYDGIVISAKHVAIPMIDDEETLILEEESQSKMRVRQITERLFQKRKLRGLSDSIFEAELEVTKFSHNDLLKREKSMKENVDYDYCDIETKNVELENSVAKMLSENKRLCKEINHVKQVFVITSLKKDLRKLKGKETVDSDAQIPSATIIVSGMFKLDLDPLAPGLLQNREAHIDYLKYTQEHANILWGIELLVYVRDTCPNAIKLSAKKVAVTPINNVKKVRFSEPLTSSSNIKQPKGNKKNDRISQTPSRNMKNKVEAQPRKVNKKNHVVEPICDVDVKHSLSNVNFEPICATCNKCMFDGIHDICLLALVKNVNGRSKSAKKHKKQNVWKPTGHVFTEVGFKWKPTGRTFTLVGNSCALTRITTTK